MKKSFALTLLSIIAASLLSIFPAGCSNHDEPAQTTFRGVVTDAYNGNPHPGVTVRIGASSAVTGEDGGFVMTDPPLGKQTITASKAGHADYRKDVEIKGGGEQVHNIALLDLIPLAKYPATNPYWQMDASFMGNGPLLADWNPDNDPHLIFYRPTIPLASRSQAGPQNSPGWSAFYSFSTDAYPMLMTIGSNEASVPPHGDDNQRPRNYTYWHHTERFIAFGGYWKVGGIQVPSPGWIRAAHQNGVPIMGTIFFDEDNQKMKTWILNALSRPEVSVQLAGKLALLAREYGFDGYLINQETTNHTGDHLAVNNVMATFIQDIHKAGNDQRYPVGITWYQVFSDSFTPSALLDAATGKQNTDYVYVDHGWGDDSVIDDFRNRYAAFPLKDVSNGINIASAAKWGNQDWFQYGVQNDYIDSPPVARLDYIKNYMAPSSAGLFALHAITPDGADTLKLTDIDQKRAGYMNTLANYAKCYTTVASAPFITYFNTGQGDQYFRGGSSVLPKKWSDMGQQDLLPAYRQNLSFAYDDAYYGGASLEVTGSAALYETAIPIGAETVFEVIYKFRYIYEGASCKLVLTLDSGKALEVPLSTSSLKWTSSKIHLGGDAGQSIVRISVVCSSQMNLLLGKIFAGIPDEPRPVISTGISTAQASNGYYSTVVWNAEGANYAYEIYDGEDFLGMTKKYAFIAFASSPLTQLRVTPVSFSGKR